MDKETKPCPFCKEEILKNANICKHCKSKLDIGSRLQETGKNITGCGCALTALTILVLLALLLLGLL